MKALSGIRTLWHYSFIDYNRWWLVPALIRSLLRENSKARDWKRVFRLISCFQSPMILTLLFALQDLKNITCPGSEPSSKTYSLLPGKAVCPEASRRALSARMACFMHNGGTFRSRNGTNAHVLCPVPLTDTLNWARLPFSMDLGVVSESGYTQNFKQCLKLIIVSIKN